MIWIAAAILTIFFGVQVFSLVSVLQHTDKKLEKRKDFPMVSILLAARNEEQLILRNLTAINALNYPKDRLEVLIGNDDSSDNTAQLVTDFIQDKPHFQLFHIDKTVGKGRGKANVLGQLAHKASGEFYFITDVDVKLPQNWILALLQEFTDGVGLVSGTTKCERGSLFATLQSIDWLHFMGYIKAFANVGIGCTSVGNNMVVRAEAYWQTGGYEEIDFSITEDYKLFQEVTNRGWEWRTLLGPDSLGLAWYIPSVKEMLHQRKRWLIGARELPLNWKGMIILYGLFIPVVLAIFWFNPRLAFAIWISKFLVQSVFIIFLCLATERRPFSFLYLLVYEFYVILNTAATAIFYWLPIQSVWKGREYNLSSFGTISPKVEITQDDK
ncbi:glycosyltransferase [Bacteroidia bacterium]|jgi:cellulose synthase/poly-beta-1,6-N-acetylglucosamine synthase-like glycosyltransferase|nr:glycosyltransferase [Bacteroidia bacterium]MDB0055385.1 glycosyltransferase [Bacteroidia bacterium]MDC0104346.1 glycosyltransferase [Bacteroidia bacterium]